MPGPRSFIIQAMECMFVWPFLRWRMWRLIKRVMMLMVRLPNKVRAIVPRVGYNEVCYRWKFIN